MRLSIPYSSIFVIVATALRPREIFDLIVEARVRVAFVSGSTTFSEALRVDAAPSLLLVVGNYSGHRHSHLRGSFDATVAAT